MMNWTLHEGNCIDASAGEVAYCGLDRIAV